MRQGEHRLCAHGYQRELRQGVDGVFVAKAEAVLAVSHQPSALSQNKMGWLPERITRDARLPGVEGWEKAHDLTLEVYCVTKGFPKEELFGLTSQARRASASVAANIAEGCCRSGVADFARFLQMAMGSASELDYHLLLARDLNLLGSADYEKVSAQVTEVKRMLASFIKKLAESHGLADSC